MSAQGELEKGLRDEVELLIADLQKVFADPDGYAALILKVAKSEGNTNGLWCRLERRTMEIGMALRAAAPREESK